MLSLQYVVGVVIERIKRQQWVIKVDNNYGMTTMQHRTGSIAREKTRVPRCTQRVHACCGWREMEITSESESAWKWVDIVSVGGQRVRYIESGAVALPTR